MDSKWQCVVFVMTASLFVNYALAHEVPASCPKPENAVPVTLNQLEGVWYMQLIAAPEGWFASSETECNRLEFVPTDDNIKMQVWSGFNSSTGQFWQTYSRISQLNTEVFRAIPLNQTNFWFDSSILLLTDDAIVISTCQYVDGKQVQQYVQIRTRSKTVDQEYLDDLLAKAKVTYPTKYFYRNPSYCYTLDCPSKCKSG